jgi:ABC-type transport system involved in multi-copper enzyme maturation permease subunit
MLKKEFREIIVPALLRSSMLLIFPLFSLLGITRVMSNRDYFTFFSGILGIAAIWIAATYGLDAFKSEHRDQALEYLLSFPFSRFKIVLYKLIPRISILTVLVAANLVVNIFGLSDRFEKGFYFMFFLFLFSLVMFFLLSGFFISLFFETKPSRILYNTAVILSMVAISMGIHSLLKSGELDRHLYEISFLIGCVMVMLLMGIAFVSVYKKFDLKPARVHGSKFLLRALLPLTVLAAVGLYIFFKHGL